jgi:hypothetical protein
MNTRLRLIASIALVTILVSANLAQESGKQSKPKLITTTASNPVAGSGTAGQITKWTGVDGTNTYTIGNSAIFEDKFGKVGIGTTAPTSLLTVKGMIETTLGGYKFPDGTVQTTSAAGSLFMVAHDNTLQGNGTLASPLGVALPLSLVGPSGTELLFVRNSNPSGIAINGIGGGSSTSSDAGIGVIGLGGMNNANGRGGAGIEAAGGFSHGEGGAGSLSFGGNSDSLTGSGGIGIFAGGGVNNNMRGGDGVFAIGGDSNNVRGGDGINASGGDSFSGVGGDGIIANPGHGATTGLAGLFNGNVQVTGNLSKGGGSFKIDHPLDPANKYLYHSFVESPDMMNIYNGNVTTDANGEATVTLPDWFEALNKDFRYQLTVIGQFAQAIVAQKVKGNHFIIKTNTPGVEVSWQVTGIRQDAYANHHRIPVEEAKPDAERGFYLHPEAFDQAEEKSVVWARHPELMQQSKKKPEPGKQKEQTNNQ